jgi:hypothetical protein
VEPPDRAAQPVRLDALIDVIVGKYAPLPGASLNGLISRLRYGTPQWTAALAEATRRARKRLAHARVDGVDWYWPEGEDPRAPEPHEEVRLLAPFDPIAWDRRRFELLWDWAYRFEAYVPPARRKLGYYALPLLWRDRIIGWGNIAVRDDALASEFGYVSGTPPRSVTFRRELEAELERMRRFLSL